MNRLVRLYASNPLKAEAITAAGDYLRKLGFTTASQLADENLGLGNDTGQTLTQNHSKAVRRFYLATKLEKYWRSFLLGIKLKDLGIDKVTASCL